MNEGKKHTGSLRPRELEAVYAISRAVAEAENTEDALDRIVQLVRPVFIFDSMVLYTCCQTNGSLDPAYARAIGRGRTREADLTWGEATAQQVHWSQETVTQIEQGDTSDPDRTSSRHSLGLPLYVSGQALGALVFIRFGGPIFLPEQIHLAEFIAQHVAQLLQHRQLVDQIANLEARRRLDTLQEDFIATISHELLTPLGFIKGYTTTLLREDTTWDENIRREFLSIIDEESDRLRELIDNLMDSSRLQAGTLRMSYQPIRLDTLIKDIAVRAQTRHDNLDIELQIDSPGLQIHADPARLGQVFDNILSNAIKYAPGSKVRITMKADEEHANVSIRDFGPGIAQQHLDNLFQRFYRVPDASTTVRGSGLGLYICRKIIQAHHGEITARSAVGQGTTFFITLPIHPTLVRQQTTLGGGNEHNSDR
jgi:signal transduction histidine kinase